MGDRNEECPRRQLKSNEKQAAGEGYAVLHCVYYALRATWIDNNCNMAAFFVIFSCPPPPSTLVVDGTRERETVERRIRKPDSSGGLVLYNGFEGRGALLLCRSAPEWTLDDNGSCVGD